MPTLTLPSRLKPVPRGLPAQITGDFLPQVAQQRYSCLALNQRYRYEGIFRGFTAELDVDKHGLVLDYPETFRRVR
ncbi:putative glycolipid-binding domain-containing protein [Pseudomonas sp. DWP3-1-2]|uniref:putative glycolipid-binding domain-containing protein n=1 Tax=Pseudomonas sp. DWP3-1-2 TaxID=2804645 RepID=UPI003CFB1208